MAKRDPQRTDKLRIAVRYLLERNESGELTEDEVDELDRFGEFEHLMQLVKACAQVYLSDSVRAADDRK